MFIEMDQISIWVFFLPSAKPVMNCIDSDVYSGPKALFQSGEKKKTYSGKEHISQIKEEHNRRVKNRKKTFLWFSCTYLCLIVCLDCRLDGPELCNAKENKEHPGISGC